MYYNYNGQTFESIIFDSKINKKLRKEKALGGI